jgi:hypothetical protein
MYTDRCAWNTSSDHAQLACGLLVLLPKLSHASVNASTVQLYTQPVLLTCSP